MKRILLGTAALFGPVPALADGIDLSGQPVTLMFRDGTYAEIGYTNWRPTLTGADQTGTDSRMSMAIIRSRPAASRPISGRNGRPR
ncbi:hypothetical protein [Amaricoccus sp. W119]|uniref:hypothetical protein n=1 Tax=Amaricoccus sp. W119 TaxID=3391833 RepID=UPI0039A53A16